LFDWVNWGEEQGKREKKLINNYYLGMSRTHRVWDWLKININYYYYITWPPIWPDWSSHLNNYKKNKKIIEIRRQQIPN